MNNHTSDLVVVSPSGSSDDGVVDVEWREQPPGVAVARSSLLDRAQQLGVPTHAMAGTSGLVVLVSRHALDIVEAHVGADVSREHGGLLVGTPFLDPSGAWFLEVETALPAHYTAGSPSHLKFSAESWRDLWHTDSLTARQRMVGWYHSHPGLGVFMSPTDLQTHALHFAQPWQVALVVDPVARAMDFFAVGDEGAMRRVTWFPVGDDPGGVQRENPAREPPADYTVRSS